MVDFRDSLVARRISLTLILSIFLEIVAPAFALPDPQPKIPGKPSYPQARRHSRSKRDPLLQGVLQKAAPHLGDLPQGADTSLFPNTAPSDSEQSDGHEVSPTSSPTPEASGTPALIEPTAVDEDNCGSGNVTSGTGPSEMAVLMADPRQVYPPFEVARQTHANGNFLKPQFINGAHEVFVTDYLTHFTQRFDNLGSREILTFDITGPNQNNNRTSRNTAASLEWRYTAEGTSPSDLKARYQLEIRTWDARGKSGRKIFSRKEATKLCFLRPHFGVAARDTGDWHVKIHRNGQLIDDKVFCVFAPPVAEHEGFSRRTAAGFSELDDGVAAYTDDESIHYQKTYVPAAPDHHGRQSTSIQWDYIPPKIRLLSTSERSLQSLTLDYESDGVHSTVTRKIFDSLYPHGHVYSVVSSAGRLPSLLMQGGPGLEQYGSWKFREKRNHHTQPLQSFEVRSILSRVITPAGNTYLNDGEIAYQIQVATFPTDWDPGDMGWHLALRSPGQGPALAEFNGVFLADSATPVRTFLQKWDGRTDSTGDRIRPGTRVIPELTMSLLSSDAPQLRPLRTQAANTNLNAFAVAPLAAGGDNYHLETDQNSGFFLVDDDLYLYLDNDEVPVYADTDGVRTYIKPNFQARRGQSLRMIAVDSFGLCRELEGPIYLVHDSTGQRQLLRRFTLDDGCRNWPRGYAFIDISYTIEIPTGNVAVKTQLPPNNSVIAQDYWTFIDNLSLGGPGSMFGLDPQQQILSSYPPTKPPVVTVDTTNDNRGKEPYPFKGVSCATDNANHSSPIDISVSEVNGYFYHHFVDLAVATRGLPLLLGRSYVSERENLAPNFGWCWDFEEALLIFPGAQQAILKGATGEESIFSSRSGEYFPVRPDQTDALKKLDSRHYEVTFKNHTRHVFEVPSSIDLSNGQPYRAVLKQKIDNNGNTNTYTWDLSGKKCLLLKGPNPSQFLRLTWTSGDRPRLRQAEDHTGRCVSYDYTRVDNPLSGVGEDYLLTQITQPGGKVYQHSYHPILGTSHYRLLDTALNGVLQEKIAGCDDSLGVLKEVTHLLGATMSFERVENPSEEYDCTKVTKSGQGMPENTPQVTKTFLDDLGRVVTQYDANLNRNHIEYDGSSNPISATDPCGHQSFYEFDDHRNMRRSTNSLNETTEMSYNDSNDLIEIKNALEETTVLGWDERSNLISVRDNLGHEATLVIDALGLVQSMTNSSGNTWTLGYDSQGFLNQKTVPATSDGQPAATWHYVNDSLGRRVKSTDPLQRESTSRFDTRDRLVEATVPAVSAQFRQEAQGRRSIHNCFDRNDLLLASTSLDGQRTVYSYDKAHRLKSVKLPGYPTPTRLEYDIMENLVAMTNNAGQTTRYELDVLNRTKAMTYPNGDQESYRFSHCSVLEEWTRGDQVITYDHDHLDRITALHSPATQDEVAWTFDPVGRVKTMRESSGITTEYSYTPNDLLASAMRSDSRGIRYFYDEGDRLRRTEDQDSDGTDYHYNERNEIVAVDHDQRTVNYRYDLVGRAIGSTLPNGVECQRTFDERNRLVYLNYQRGSDPLLTFKYGHNQLGQRIVEEKTSPEQCKLSRFCYNLRRELTQSDRRIGNGCNTVTQYRYDLNHNRIGRDQFIYENNNADQLTAYTGPEGAANLAYNAQGQATDVGGFTFSYNQDQQIKEASGPHGESKYFYDGSGRRVAKEVNGEREDYLSLGSEVLKTYQNGELKARYFLGLGREGIQTDGEWKYYLTDGLGSTAALTDESGNSVAAYDYGDYGETTQIAGDTDLYNPYLYTGQEWDAELGMYNLRARHYSPTLGRFIARDPIGYGGGSNLYSYCQGDPIDFADPRGLFQGVVDEAKTQNLLALLKSESTISSIVNKFDSLRSKCQVQYGHTTSVAGGYTQGNLIAIDLGGTKYSQALILLHEVMHYVVNVDMQFVPKEVVQLGQTSGRLVRYIHAWIYATQGSIMQSFYNKGLLTTEDQLRGALPGRAYNIFSATKDWSQVVKFLDEKNIPDHLGN